MIIVTFKFEIRKLAVKRRRWKWCRSTTTTTTTTLWCKYQFYSVLYSKKSGWCKCSSIWSGRKKTYVTVSSWWTQLFNFILCVIKSNPSLRISCLPLIISFPRIWSTSKMSWFQKLNISQNNKEVIKDAYIPIFLHLVTLSCWHLISLLFLLSPSSSINKCANSTRSMCDNHLAIVQN